MAIDKLAWMYIHNINDKYGIDWLLILELENI